MYKPKRRSLDIGPGPIPTKGTTHALDMPQWPGMSDRWDAKTRRLEWGNKAFERIKFRYGDATKLLPYPNNSFDRVTVYNALGNEINPYLAMKEIARVLRYGGMFTFVIYDTETDEVFDAIRQNNLKVSWSRRVDEVAIRIHGKKL